MKNLSLICIFILGFQSFAQEQQSLLKNEIKLNLLASIIGAPEITYERNFADNQSVGVLAAVSLDSRQNLIFNYGILPFYRVYFGKKYASGFFVEANTSITNYHYQERYYNTTNGINYYYSEKWKNETNFGIGASIGLKLLTKNNLTGEIVSGVVRRFGDVNADIVVPRMGISLGKRF